jgi:hypothetical protein
LPEQDAQGAIVATVPTPAPQFLGIYSSTFNKNKKMK